MSQVSEMEKVGVVGLGYVGLPLLVEIAKSGFHAVGIDVDQVKVDAINNGENYIEDVNSGELKDAAAAGRISATTDWEVVRELDAVSICVPTPLRKTKDPDISYIMDTLGELAPRVIRRFRQFTNSPDNIVVVGNGPLTDKIIGNVEKNRIGTIIGIIWNNGAPRPGDYQGYPVLGSLGELTALLQRYRVDTLIIATHQPWYSEIIEVLSNVTVKNLTIRWVPHDLSAIPADQLPDQIPLRDFSV